MLQENLFANSKPAKEITESFAAHNAALKYENRGFNPNNSDIGLVAVGDGVTPRTAGTFAYMTNWECHSVDPQLRMNGKHPQINRLHMHPSPIQEVSFEFEKAVVPCVHSHVGLPETLRSIEADDLLLIAMECCEPLRLGVKPDKQYADWGIHSPQREIAVWRFENGVPEQAYEVDMQ